MSGPDEFPEHELDGEEIEGLDKFTLRSVGIDIGSATTHVIFSSLIVKRGGASLADQFNVTQRQILHRSTILLTPYLSQTLIDTDKVKEFVGGAYREAGFSRDDIDTGAVIITGEALKKENARPISEFFAQEAGKFCCVTAGPNHESLLAAHGSGAVALSRAERATVMNVDIGGGTAKLAVIHNGVVTGTAAVNVGSRLIAFDDANIITRLEKPGKSILEKLGYNLSVGKRLLEKEKNDIADFMTRVLFEVIQGNALSAPALELMTTEPLNDNKLETIEHLVFSGGVSEYIYGRSDTAYGDLGTIFGEKIRARLSELPQDGLLQEPVEGIRATVIGAGQYTLQASTSTTYISSTGLLPVFGLKAVCCTICREHSVEKIRGTMEEALRKFDLPGFTNGIALALALDSHPDYPCLRKVAEAIFALVQESDNLEATLFIVVNRDVAKALGEILKEGMKLPHEVIAADGIQVGDLDYLDISRPLGMSDVMLVTVKSLIFPA